MTVGISYFAGAGWQFADANGNPLAGGKLYSYTAGTTSLVSTYTDSTGTVSNSNPIILDSAGRVPYEIWVTVGSNYKFVLNTALDVLIGTWDNIPAVNDGSGLAQFIADLANSSDATKGTALVGYKPPGAGSVGRTLENKLYERISVKDFGAKGDNIQDDTTYIQAAITYANSIGADIYFPPGEYIVSSQLTLDNSTSTDPFMRKASIYGDAPGSVSLMGAAGNYTMLSILGGDLLTGGAHSQQVIRGLYFIKADNLGGCIAIDDVAFFSMEDVFTYKGGTGIYCSNILSSTFYNVNVRFATNGMRFEHTVKTADTSYPNNINLVGCEIGNNTKYGIWVIKGATFNMLGGAVEGNGSSGTSASTDCWGVLLSDSGQQGATAGSFTGVYFEANVGVADLWLANTVSPSSMSVTGCSFARVPDASGYAAAKYVVNNIKVESSGSGINQTVGISGCGFRYFNSYIPNAARLTIANVQSSSAVNSIAWSGSLFQSATDAPVVDNQLESVFAYCTTLAAGGLNTGARAKNVTTGNVVKNSTGDYTVTYTTPTSYSVTTPVITPIGNYIVEIFGATGTSVNYRVRTAAAVLTDAAVSMIVYGG